MPEGRSHAQRGRSRGGSSGGSVANESRLVALGDAVDRKNGTPRKKKSRRRHRGRRIAVFTAIALVLAVVVVGAGGYVYGYYKFNAIPKQKVTAVHPYVSGTPFNVLIIGSDSRAGLSGTIGAKVGAGSVAGQRSDAIKIVHVDPGNQTVSMVSIPRDTLVKLLANQNLYTNYNRINVNYGGGPNLLVKTIEANFGIPINHVVQVSFGGLVDAASTLGGVYLNFPYPTIDPGSGLRVMHPGCQLVSGFQTLAFVRSRHYYYNVDHYNKWDPNWTYSEIYDHGWIYDGTSDYGRIQRQDTFMRAMIDAAKGKYNPLTINSFITQLSKGVVLDSTWSYNELLGLAYDFRNFHSSSMQSYTLPTVSDGYVSPYGDVLSVQEPEAQQLLVKIFGNELKAPTAVPPNEAPEPLVIPHIAITSPTTTTSTSTTVASSGSSGHHKKKTTAPTTTTTLVPAGYASFNPTPCSPA